MGIILIPSLITSLLDLFQKPGDVLLGQHILAAIARERQEPWPDCIYAPLSAL